MHKNDAQVEEFFAGSKISKISPPASMRFLYVFMAQMVCLVGSQSCTAGIGCPELAGMAEVIASTTLNVIKGGKPKKKVMHLQRLDDPATIAKAFCFEYKLPDRECEKVIALAEKRHADALSKKTEEVKPTLHLILQHYNDPFNKRREELEACMRFNLHNPHVAQVHNLIETDTTLPQWITNHPKSVIVKHGPRLSFKAAFEYANEKLPVGTTAVIMNLDTYLDHSSPWNQFTGDIASLTNNRFQGPMSLTLSRTETDLTGRIWRNADLEASAYSMAQDAWVFKTPIQVQDVDYPVGNCPGSDNALADRLNRAGYTPMNFAHLFRLYHLDVARKAATAEELPKMIVTRGTDMTRPHLRGQRIVPVFGDISTFEDLKQYKHIWGEVDPVIEYMFVLEYMGMKARIQQKFANGGIIPDNADVQKVDDLKKEWARQLANGVARPDLPATANVRPDDPQQFPEMKEVPGAARVRLPNVNAAPPQ